ncbi:MAG: hydrogenase 3 maturation endopeptidase HyCI [Candidatus Hodarchaeales archaeon]
MTLYEELAVFLEDYSKIAIVCVGNDLRGDDAVGVLIYDELIKSHRLPDSIHVFNGGTLPENLTKPIREINASHMLIIDAAEFGSEPGDVGLFTPESITGSSFSTHTLPLTVFYNFLSSATGTKLAIIGIQPGNTEFAELPGKSILNSVKDVTETLLKLFSSF